MITVLLVGVLEEGAFPKQDDPSLEILTARDADEALERLGRNRRIDAVLLAPGLAKAAAEQIRRDDPSGPPLFAAGGPPVAHAVALAPGEHLLGALLAHLSAGNPEPA
jgi:hypothetical protein